MCAGNDGMPGSVAEALRMATAAVLVAVLSAAAL